MRASPEGFMDSAKTRALLAMVFTVVIWGIGPVFLRNLSVELGAADHLAIRYALVSILFAAGLAWTGGWRIARADWPRLLIVSSVGMVGYNLGSAFGFERISAGIGSLIIGTQPLLIALFGAVIAKERLGPAAITGLAVAFAGTAVLVSGDLALAGDGWTFAAGCAFVFFSGMAWAIYVVVSKPLVQKYGSFNISAISIVIATAIMLPLLARPSTLTTLTAMTMKSWFDMAYIVIPSTFIGAITWNFAAARMPSAAAGAFLYLVPVIGVAAGAAMLSETITPNMLAGGALILAGVAIAQFGPLLRANGNLAALAALIFAVTMWGLIPVAMRFLILGTSPEAAMVLRLYPAGLIAIIAVLIVGVRQIEWRDWGRIVIAALVGNVGYQILAAYGMQSVPASWTGLLFGLEPVFIALFAVMLAGDRLTPWLVGGIALALLGTAALMLGSTLLPTGDVSLWGVLLVTLSTMGWGIYTVVIRPVSAKYGSFQIACLAIGISALPMVFFVPPDIVPVIAALTPMQWTTLFFVVVFGTFLAISAWNYALGHMESSAAGMFLYAQPVVAAIGGIVILDEHLTWPLIAGGTLIIAGVALAQFGPRLRKAQLEPLYE
jgi:drug/metabolite transporter (DMT)-like permease